MPEPEIRNPKCEFRRQSEGRGSADILVGFDAQTKVWFCSVARLVLATVKRTGMSALRGVGFGGNNAIPFRRYRVAPRLGTDAVRRRLLLGLHAHAPLTATETGVA